MQTEDVREAERRKQQHLDLVVNKIKAIRSGDDSALLNAALYWRKMLKDATDNEGAYDQFLDEALDDAVGTFIDGGWSAVLKTAGADPDQHSAIRRSSGGDKVLEFMGIAKGESVPTNSYIEDWYASYDVKNKTKDLAKAEVEKFAKSHPYINQITKKAVTQWIAKRRLDRVATTTLRRSLTHLHQYWLYLQRIEEVPEEYNPFVGHQLKKKNGGSVDVVGFSPEEVAKIIAGIAREQDQDLKCLVLIAVYSGMRIEEICAMKLSDVAEDRFRVTDAKTKAGVRDVPIHKVLKPLIKHLTKMSKDGYLISGLSENKYGDRSSAIGKRFGRLKKKLGFTTRSHVFHSLRHSFSTALLQAEASSVVIDFLLGHKSGNLAIDTYSDGVSFKQKKDAINKIKGFPVPKECMDLK